MFKLYINLQLSSNLFRKLRNKSQIDFMSLAIKNDYYVTRSVLFTYFYLIL